MFFYLSNLCKNKFLISVITLEINVCLNRRDLQKRRPSIIIMNICFNLCVGYIIFLAGVKHAKWIEVLCTANAFFLHFFFLAAWGWMTVYSYDLYISIVVVSTNKRLLLLTR